MPVVTLSSGNSLINDLQISSQPASSASGTTFTVGVTAYIYRSLLFFDLGLIPNDAIINSATLKLTRSGSNSLTSIDAHRVLGDWNNGTTWGGQPSFDQQKIGTFAITTSVTLDLKSLVQAWVDGTYVNHGIILKSPDESVQTTVAFYSSEYGGPNSPQLTIDYTIPTTGKKQVEYVGKTAVDNTVQATSKTIPLPSGVQQGDLLLAQLSHSSSSVAIVPPAGWTTLVDVGVAGIRHGVFYKFAVPSEVNPTFTSSSGRIFEGALMAFRNVKQVGETFAANPSATSVFSPPATNTIYNKAVLLLLNATIGSPTATPPLSFSEINESTNSTAQVNAQVSMRYMHDKKSTVATETQTTLSTTASGESRALYLEPIVNNPPTLTLTSPADNQTLAEGSSVLLGSTNDFILRISPSDPDVSDALEYTIILRGVTKQPYTACANGVAFDYSIPYADLLLGNNAVQVTVRDNNGGQATINFTLRNKAPSTISQQSVLQVLTALGYPNASATCLNDLKPSDYGTVTISLSEILNSLD
ncbi:DNRLRE domain-containing protein [Brevibacillus centrosporus]|uniref:DNRLRE domain-containing protein n=1 Tax=Brevibacillus centrosporus TaxID=54910 RepID=UPI002E220F5C|nr:DNRLRE domain-containing protein [Brevibacillus centrosporus]